MEDVSEEDNEDDEESVVSPLDRKTSTDSNEKTVKDQSNSDICKEILSQILDLVLEAESNNPEG